MWIVAVKRDVVGTCAFTGTDAAANSPYFGTHIVTDRCTSADLRKHVRKLDSHELFSKEWLSMVDSLVHISNIALRPAGSCCAPPVRKELQ